MINKVKAEPPVLTTANADEIDLPRSLLEAVDLFEADEDLGAILGKSFTATYAAIKRAEFETFMLTAVIRSKVASSTSSMPTACSS